MNIEILFNGGNYNIFFNLKLSKALKIYQARIINLNDMYFNIRYHNKQLIC